MMREGLLRRAVRRIPSRSVALGQAFAWTLVLAAASLSAVDPVQAGTVTLSWEAPALRTDGAPATHVAGYRLYASLTSLTACPPTSLSQFVASNVATPAPGMVVSAPLNGLIQGMTYYIRVTAVDQTGLESACSNEITAVAQADPSSSTTSALPAPAGAGGAVSTLDVTPPSVPGVPTVTATGPTSVSLSWAPSTDQAGVVGYRVFQNGLQITTTGRPDFSRTGLTAGTTYSYAVAAYDASGNVSGLSAAAVVTTPGGALSPDRASAPPAVRTIELSPSDADRSCTEAFTQVANTLRAGETLILRGGTYSQSCARVLSNLRGTAEQPIVIRAAAGERPVLTRPVRPNGDYDHDNIEIADSSYVTIQGLVFRGGDVGVRLRGANRHLTIEHGEIAETGGAGFTAIDGETEGLTLRHLQIHHTGRLTPGPTSGAGIVLGCPRAACRALHSRIEQNHVHDLRGATSGDHEGIAVMAGSGGNIIRHNVIHTTTQGPAAPCILVTGGGPLPNHVDGNVAWQCGEALVAVADAVVRNNIVAHSTTGLASYPHADVPVMRGVSLINNTVYGHADCASLRWTGAIEMTLANNAFYCGDRVAVSALGLSAAGVRVAGNYVEGALAGVSLDGARFLGGGTAAGAFVDPGALDFWPAAGSPLRNAASVTDLPLTDFNGLPRSPSRDVGAYATKGLSRNVGWRIAPGFKVLSADNNAPAKPRGARIR